MTKLKRTHYSQLTPKDLLYLMSIQVCNWCGWNGESFFARMVRSILRFLLMILKATFFEASCMIHDFTYWQWGTWTDRLKDDWGFFVRILKDIFILNKNPIRIAFYIVIDILFFVAVRCFGWMYFNFTPHRRVTF